MPDRTSCDRRWTVRPAGAFIAVTVLICSCSRTHTVPPVGTAPPARPVVVPSVGTVLPQQEIIPVEWTSEPWKPDQQTRDWNYIVIHHTASPTGSVESIHQTHLARRDADGNPWRGIGYHFVIGNGRGMEDGVIEPTFRWRDQIEGAHAGNQTFNQQGIGICLVGNFEQQPPTEAQLASLVRLIETLSADYDIATENVKRHGELKATACPGKFFPMQQLTQTLSSGG